MHRKWLSAGTIGIAAAALLASAGEVSAQSAAGSGQSGGGGRRVVIPLQRNPLQDGTYVYNTPGENVVIQVAGGRLAGATYNGEAVPEARIRLQGSKIQILNEKGEEIFARELPRGPRTPTLYQVHRAPSTSTPPAPPAPPAPSMASGGARSVPPAPPTPPAPPPPDMASLRAMRTYAAAAEPPPPVMVGLSTAAPSDAIRSHFKLPQGAAMITGIYEGLPADQAGLKQYDIIVSADGEPLTPERTLTSILHSKKPGETLRLEVIHEGEQREFELALVPYDSEKLGQQPVTFFMPEIFATFDAERAGVDDEVRRRVEELLQQIERQGLNNDPQEAAELRQSLQMAREALRAQLGEERMQNEQLREQTEVRRGEVERARGRMERVQRESEALRRRLAAQGIVGTAEGDRMMVFTTPDGEGEDRLKSVEDRLARLERLLEKLVEQNAAEEPSER